MLFSAVALHVEHVVEIFNSMGIGEHRIIHS